MSRVGKCGENDRVGSPRRRLVVAEALSVSYTQAEASRRQGCQCGPIHQNTALNCASSMCSFYWPCSTRQPCKRGH